MRVNYIGKYDCKIIIWEQTLSIIRKGVLWGDVLQEQKSLKISVAFSNKRFEFFSVFFATETFQS